MTHKIFLAAALLSASALFTASAFAGELKAEAPSSVLELFTSQGCSSCPPANNFVTRLADEPRLLSLTYGVHYWDYLGWKDTFASPEFTKRQRAYGAAFDTGNVYTPQIVLNGAAHSPRYSKKDVASMQLKPNRPKLTLSETDGELTYSFDEPSNYQVVVVAYTGGTQEVPVKRGENGGRTLTLSNVVTDVFPVAGGNTDVEIKSGTNYAVLVHDPKTAKIVTAAVYKAQ